MLRLSITLAISSFCVGSAMCQDLLQPLSANAVLKDFRFASGETLAEITIHYRTFGTLKKDDRGVATNAVLILHGTTGSGANFLTPMFSQELFGHTQLLDVTKHYIVLPDNLGHGQSTRPSSGLKAKFPRYGYRDMISAQHRLLTERLGVNHLRLVMGTSMGGMHTWLWGQYHPEFMDALVPLASLPTQISGRNRMWRKTISDAIRNDPTWKDGDYSKQPTSLRTAIQIMNLMSNNPVNWHQKAPTLTQADEVFAKATAERLARSDANDVLYAIEASWDYDPGPGLDKILAPLLAINFADDLINPPELGILEREIKRVPRGKAVLIPAGPDTVGHGTHTKAAVWKRHLGELLANLPK